MRGIVGHFLRTPEGRAFLVKVPAAGKRSSRTISRHCELA
jgi:hypothetical protein